MLGKAKETFEDNLKNTNNYLMYLFLDEISADKVVKCLKIERFHSFKTLCWIEAEHAVLFCLRTWAWFGLRLRRRRLSSQICIDPVVFDVPWILSKREELCFVFVLVWIRSFPPRWTPNMRGSILIGSWIWQREIQTIPQIFL